MFAKKKQNKTKQKTNKQNMNDLLIQHNKKHGLFQ